MRRSVVALQLRREGKMAVPIDDFLRTALRKFEAYQRTLLVSENVEARLRGAEQFVDFLLRGPVRRKHERVQRRKSQPVN